MLCQGFSVRVRVNGKKEGSWPPPPPPPVLIGLTLDPGSIMAFKIRSDQESNNPNINQDIMKDIGFSVRGRVNGKKEGS